MLNLDTMGALFRWGRRPVRAIDKGRVIAGIIDGRRAFAGPEVLHLDLTNECNNNCIGCWCRSPLLGEREMPDWEKHKTLSYDLVKGVIDDLAVMGGLRQVKLVGGGEPFMHPRILDIIAYFKRRMPDVQIDINTNFTLVDFPKAEKLVELGVDSLTVSLWAGDPRTYVATHPSKSGEDFTRMGEVLSHLAAIKKGKPWVKIFNVISNRNHTTVDTMLSFALDVRADDVQFVLHDPIPGKTDCLLLNGEQSRELLTALQGMKKGYTAESRLFRDEKGRSIMITELDGVISRLSSQTASEGVYDAPEVMRIPCYVGWLFARILATGAVVPCCKGHRMSMGNVNERRFRRIWHSRVYDEFRFKAKHMDKKNPYFRRIGNDASAVTGCYNCDNLWQNQPMHALISALPVHPRKKKWLS